MQCHTPRLPAVFGHHKTKRSTQEKSGQGKTTTQRPTTLYSRTSNLLRPTTTALARRLKVHTSTQLKTNNYNNNMGNCLSSDSAENNEEPVSNNKKNGKQETAKTSSSSPAKKKSGGGSKTTTTKQSKPKKNTTAASPVGKKPGNTGRFQRKTTGKAAKSAANQEARKLKKPDEPEDPFANADPSRWNTSKLKFSGSATFVKLGKQQEVQGKSITKAIEKFNNNPGKYLGLFYQTDMLQWPKDSQNYTLVHRAGTVGYKPQEVKDGFFTLHLTEYQRLPPFEGNVLPKKYRDKYTDNMSYAGRKLHSNKNLPIMPGRGMGLCDAPHLKIIGDVDPSDIDQGTVGDCWLLSGISSLAEFDGAVKRLFRKTKHLHKMPRDEPNMYTISLWDLATWKEVDIQVDERLCVTADGSGQLLGAKPSEDGELWVCYLEKALAAHCGGWDKIKGGQCTHAWAMLTGCKEQYTIRPNKSTGKYVCHSKFNPIDQKWEKQANCPHEGFQGVWPSAWPKVGGGGEKELELDQEELFERLCAWDDENYIIGAGTTGKNAKKMDAGLVGDHAYSVIDCFNDVAGTDIDLLKIRNPWGSGEIQDGMFDDDGPGWDKYPQIKAYLKPVDADDGIFYVTKQEFFKFFNTIYLSASNMTEFIED